MKRLNIKSGETDGIVWLELSGSLDTSTSEFLEKTFAELIERGKLKVVADLRELNFISSSGIGVLVGNCNELRERGGDLKLASPQPRVAKALELLNLLEIFDVFPSKEQAVASFRS